MQSSSKYPMPEKELYKVQGMTLTKTELLFQRMTGLYAHKWTSAYGTEPTPEWRMVASNCTAEMIKRGLDRCVTEFESWPPNPLEFRALCLPRAEDFGLPSEQEAFAQIVGNVKERHPSVVLTMRTMGSDLFTLRHADEKKARSMFAAEWAKTIQFVAEGGELPEPEKQIPERPQGTAEGREKAGAKALGELKGLFT
jgi:hypothetical protein